MTLRYITPVPDLSALLSTTPERIRANKPTINDKGEWTTEPKIAARDGRGQWTIEFPDIERMTP